MVCPLDGRPRLFAIESRTAHLLAGSQVVPIVLSERAAAERERA